MGYVRSAEVQRRHYRARFEPWTPVDGVPGAEPSGRSHFRGGEGQASSWFCLVVGYGRNAVVMTQALSERGFFALAFESYRGALAELEHLRPDLLLVGCHDGDGHLTDFLSRVRLLDWSPTTLVLLDQPDEALVREALDHGADDILVPPHSVSSVLLRRQVSRKQARNARHRGKRRLTLGRLTVDLEARQVIDGQKPFSLSGREFELLVRLMEAGGEVVSREDLLVDIWGDDQASESVLDATVHRLRRRLERQLDRAHVVNTVRGVGYQLDYSLVVEPATG